MQNKKIIGIALIDAGVTTAYILLVALFMTNIESLFDGAAPSDSILVPVIMLLTFVISAAVTATAVFGRPILLYIDGQKKEALKLLGLTLVFLVLVTIFFLSIVL